MKKFIHFFKNDFEDKGRIHKAGEIFCVTEIGNDCDNCKEVDLTQAQYDHIFDYVYKNEELSYDVAGVDERKVELLKKMRSKLLNAFDIYNINVSRGITQETEIQKKVIMDWYHLILDLDVDAIQNPPKEIIYFMS